MCIRDRGYVDYFLIVWDFIRFAKSQGIAVGPGRGSAAGSIVSYCLEITNIDPKMCIRDRYYCYIFSGSSCSPACFPSEE